MMIKQEAMDPMKHALAGVQAERKIVVDQASWIDQLTVRDV